MEIKLKEFVHPGEIIAFVNFGDSFQKLKNSKQIYIINNKEMKQNIKVGTYLEKNVSSFSRDRFENACRMVCLDSNVFSRNLKYLSKTESKKLQFVLALLSGAEVFLFDHFEDGFYGKSRSYYQKLFLKLTKYGKCVLVHTEDLTFLFGMVAKFLLFRGHDYIWINDFYNKQIFDYIAKPPLISYVEYLNNKGISIEHYLEPKEVLKAIYRSVNEKEHL